MFDKKEVIIDGYKCIISFSLKLEPKSPSSNPLKTIVKFTVRIEIKRKNKTSLNVYSYLIGDEDTSSKEIDKLTKNAIKIAKEEIKRLDSGFHIESHYNELDLGTLL